MPKLMLVRLILILLYFAQCAQKCRKLLKKKRYLTVLAFAPLHTQDTEIGLGALV